MTHLIPTILALIGLAREILKYMKEREITKREKAAKVLEMKNGFRKARKENDTGDLEKAFANIGISLGAGAGMPDSKKEGGKAS